MLIKIGKKVIDSRKEPVMLVLDQYEKGVIGNMDDSLTKFLSYPVDSNPYEMLEFMKMDGDLKFEVGKFYRHTTGLEIAIVGKVNTVVYGEMLLAEQNDSPNFITIGSDEVAAVGFVEISKEEWMRKCNKKNEQEEVKNSNRFCFECKHCISCSAELVICKKKHGFIRRDTKVSDIIKGDRCFEEILNNKMEEVNGK